MVNLCPRLLNLDIGGPYYLTLPAGRVLHVSEPCGLEEGHEGPHYWRWLRGRI